MYKAKCFSFLAAIHLFFSNSYAALEPLPSNVNAFATSFYAKAMASSDQNGLFSPYSTFTCLSMAYLGAQEETASEMAKALSLTVAKKDLALQSKRLSHALKDPSNTYEYLLANALWLDIDTFVLSDFRHTLQDEFDAKIEALNFKDAKTATSIINEWTLNQTQGKIQELLSENDLSAQTRIILTNAIYYKGSWAFPFKPEQTHEAPFYICKDKQESVKMMEQTHLFSYYENNEIQMLCMPFETDREAAAKMACFFLIPKPSSTLSALEASLDSFRFQNWLEGLDMRTIHVTIPLFTITDKIDLKSTLETMGMNVPFSDKANFSGIDGLMDLYMDKVIHQSFFSIDEHGVTAAAATAATMKMTSSLEKNTPIEFSVNQPFVFGIVDLKSKVMLFLGKITNPKTATNG